MSAEHDAQRCRVLQRFRPLGMCGVHRVRRGVHMPLCQSATWPFVRQDMDWVRTDVGSQMRFFFEEHASAPPSPPPPTLFWVWAEGGGLRSKSVKSNCEKLREIEVP